MARKPSAAPFKLKYTNGKKASPSAFFQMDPTMAPAPNPAVNQAINKKVEEKITQKVDAAMSKPGDSPAAKINWKKIGKGAKKVLAGAASAFTHGLDAVYGTGKITPQGDFSFSDKDDKDNKTDNKTDMGLIDENQLESADTKYDPNKK